MSRRSRLPPSPLFLVSIWWLRCVLYTCGIILLADPVWIMMCQGSHVKTATAPIYFPNNNKIRSIGQTALHTHMSIHPINRVDISLENIYFSSSSIIFVKTLWQKETDNKRKSKHSLTAAPGWLPQAFTQDELHLNRLFCESSLMMRPGPTAILVASWWLEQVTRERKELGRPFHFFFFFPKNSTAHNFFFPVDFYRHFPCNSLLFSGILNFFFIFFFPWWNFSSSEFSFTLRLTCNYYPFLSPSIHYADIVRIQLNHLVIVADKAGKRKFDCWKKS